MDEIRAFIGHSFADADASIVDKFLKYFDTVAKLHPAFSWEHAEAAEPKQLTDKIMSLVADKNTFIGICTRSECAVREAALSKVAFRAGYRKAVITDFEWKTSDWIIQEIGLAKARNFEIILLIEDCVRRPGGLQGDVEYVSFTRDMPEKSFSKILEMITSLSPRRPSVATGLAETTAMISEKKPQSTDDDTWKDPLPNWGRGDYEYALLRAVSARDTHAESRINDIYLTTSDASVGENRFAWEAHHEWLHIISGVSGGLGKLKLLAAEHPTNTEVLGYFARGLSEYEDYAGAE